MSSATVPATALQTAAESIAASLRDAVVRPEAARALGESPELASGLTGLALALAAAGEVFDDEALTAAGRTALRRAAESTGRRPFATAGLHTGTAGLVWTMAEFASRDPRYTTSLRSATDVLARQIIATPLVPPGAGVPFQQYDVISGAAGQLAALLRAGGALGHQEAVAASAADHLVSHLCALLDPDDAGRPGWLTTPAFYPVAAPWYREQYPHGLYNLGFAHGMPGVLAALCRAADEGLGGSGLAERIERSCAWLAAHQLADGRGPAWPYALNAAAESLQPLTAPQHQAARAAWCYGAPGTSAALFAASSTLGDPAWRILAEDALARVAASSGAERNVLSPTLCHGHAGLLAVFRRAHRYTANPRWRHLGDAAAAKITEAADARQPYVVADVPRRGTVEHDPGLLTGAAGVLLALLAELAPDTAGRWDDLLFLNTARPIAGARTGDPDAG